MKQETIQMFMMKNGKCFDAFQTMEVQKQLEAIDDAKAGVLLGTNFQDPTLIILMAFLFMIDRFFLDDVGMGILKIVTCGGFGIWAIVDLFTAKKRTQEYNYNKFMQAVSMCR